MCGPSREQENLEANQASFASLLQSNYQTNLAEQQTALAHINSVLEPILSAGPNQKGFSAAEEADLNTQAIDTTGAAAARAQRAIANETAGRNDSGNLPEAGNVAALKAEAASSAAGELASEQLGISEKNYEVGRQNFEGAVAGEEDLAKQYDPLGYAGAGTSANNAAFGEATQIQNMRNQEEADIASGITSLATGALGGFAGGFGNVDTTGGSSSWEQAKNFASGFAGGFGA